MPWCNQLAPLRHNRRWGSGDGNKTAWWLCSTSRYYLCLLFFSLFFSLFSGFLPSTDVINEPLQLYTLLFLSRTVATTSPYTGSKRHLQGRRKSPLSFCQMSTLTSRVATGDKQCGLGVSVGQQVGNTGRGVCSSDTFLWVFRQMQGG